MKILGLIGASAVATCMAFAVIAQPLPKASSPEEAGFSTERLKRLTDLVRTEVDKGAIPGAVMLIARNGKIAYVDALGFRDREESIAMKPDAIFRIASMTKPITSVAIMMLVEEGKLLIDDPVSVYLPELKNLKVGIEKVDAATGRSSLSLEPARREITIQDLLRHTSGLTYGIFGKSLVKQTYVDAKVGDPNDNLTQYVAKIAQLPLAYHPGSTWDYSVSTDVLGRVVEVVSGMEFDQFVATRITTPLGMLDTGFYVPAQNLGRVAEPQIEATTGKRPTMRDVSKRPNLLSGGGGMVSTVTDYARFCQMLLNGGELDGVRILARKTVAYMTSDHLPEDIAFDPVAVNNFGAIAPMPARGQGFGLGFAVRKDTGRNPLPGSPGEFYWVGATGPAFWIDPSEKLFAIWMVQAPLGQTRHYRGIFRNLVYQALVH